MDFEIRHESAAVLKPLVNAAARTLKHAQIELGPGAMRVWGLSEDTVAGIDIKVPAEAFTTYNVEAGTFQTDIEKWKDAIRGTRKTDEVAVYTEPNDYDSLRDLYSVGTNTKRVLRDKDLDSIEALEQADPSDLVGETDYESHSETKTAEIDMEKAEEIIYEVNGSHVVLESDGERLIEGDASDHPRVRKPTLDWDRPDAQVEATPTVNGKDFSKAYRAVSKVTDAAFIGTTEGSLVLHGEGDIDVHADLDAEVDGSGAGGLYDGDWLSTLRLSMDRKASTDLTFRLPKVDRRDGEETAKHLLWADFQIGKDVKADVEWFLAPKIMGSEEEDPETEAERLSRVAPSNYSPTSNVRWDVETTGGKAKGWFSVMDSHADESKLHLEPDGVTALFVDPANVLMQDVKIGEDAFESYTWRQPAGQLYDQDRVIGISQTWITDYLKLFTKTESVRFQVDEKPQFAILGENFSVTMPTIDPDSVRREPDLPGLDLPGSVTVDAESFIEGIEAADSVSQHVGIIIYDGECYLYANGDLDQEWVAVETVEGEGYASSLFSLDYLSDYVSSIPSGATDEITIYGGREFPMFFEHDVVSEAANFRMMLAPRIQSDENVNGVYGGSEMQEHGLDPLRIKDANPIFTVNDDGYVVPDKAGESRAKTPEEVAEQNRDDTEDDPYDPTEEFGEYGPTMDTDIPTRDLLAGIEGTGLSPRDVQSQQQYTLSDGDMIHPDDAEDPERRQEFTETVAGIYDPSQDLEGDTDVFRASTKHRAGVPESIGDWDLKVQVQDGRPVYKNDGKELRVNEHLSADDPAESFYVQLRHDALQDGSGDIETLESNLSPREAMDALEAAAMERSGGAADSSSSADSVAADGGVYDPTDEFDEMEEPSEIQAIGAGREKTLDALDTKDRLDDVQTFNTLEEMTNAVREMSLARRDGRTYMSPPEDTISTIEAVYNDLPDEAKQPFLNDDRIHTKINAARKAFNRWMGKKKREQQMPSPVEAGPANYPADKARETARYAREGKEELKERIGKIKSAARGAKQRALNAIGSSVAEQNAKESEQTTKTMREKLYPGAIVFNRDTVHGLAPWGVKRLNKKSVRLKRPARDGDGYALTTVDYDSSFLRHYPREEIEDFDGDDVDADVPDELTNGYESAIRYLMGDEWVDENLDDDPDDSTDPYAGEDGLDDDQQSQIAEGAANGELKPILGAIKGLSVSGPFGLRDWKDAGIETPEDLLEHHDDRGNFERIRGVGPATSEKIESALPIVRDNLESDADEGTPAEDQPWLDELDGIGPSTYRELQGIGLSNIADAKDAYQDRAVSNTWRKALDILPSGKARVSLYQAVGADPSMSVAEDQQKAEWDHARKNEVSKPEVGNYVMLHYSDGGSVAGVVTRVDDGEALLRVGADAEPQRWDLENDRYKSTTGWEDVEVAELVEEDHEEISEETAKTEGPGYEPVPEDDLRDALEARGINRITGKWLAKNHDSIEEVEQAVSTADDVTDLTGVSEGSAEQVREAFGETDDSNETDDDTNQMSTQQPNREHAEEHRKAVEAARDADPDGDLPGPALSALKKNWSVYKRGIKEGREAVEEAEEYRDEFRPDAEEAAAIINDIREAYGQQPIDFDGVDGVPEVDELGGPITKDSPGVSLSFDWTADPYNPDEEEF